MNTRRARFRVGHARSLLGDAAAVACVLLWVAVVLGALWLAVG